MEGVELGTNLGESERAAAFAHPRGASACLPLLGAAGLTLYRENTFRITGLPVDAGTKEIARHTDRLKKFEELGFGQTVKGAAFALEPPPTLDQIREAIQRLREPERRLVDEFFWFWPATFGQSRNDPAIQAVLSGDAAKAIDIWRREEKDGAGGFVAAHNLAVMHHMLALDATLQHIASDADEEKQEQIRQHWKEALARWETLAVEDRVWQTIKERIRAYDDPRLTTGFAGRMEDSFPEALDKVNAEAALKFAEQGRLNWARLHVEFMRQTHQGRDNVTRTMELVLAPIRAQVSEGIKTARQRLEKDPKQGAQIARQLIEQSSRLSQLYDILHGSDAPYKTELFDEVALAGVDCAVSYQKSTSDDVVFLEVLRAALAFVSGPELRERIQRNIDIGEGNLRWSEIKPLREKLDRIMESKSPASVQFAEVKQQMIPELAMLAEREGVHPDLINEFSDTLGYALRALSITAHNDDDDFETAVAASRLASALARAPELKKMISDDLVVVQGTLENARKGGISLDLGREKISMSRKSVTYKGKEILVRDVTGVRYGQEALSKGSQITGRSYRVDLAGGGTEFLIETHDGFRSDESASNAYSKLVDGVYDNVVPRLLKNLSQGVMDGRPYQMGPVKIVTEGVYLAASAGEGPGHFIPWSDLRFGSRDGKLSVRSDSDPRLQVSLRLREVWNAVLFEPLINAVIEKRKKAIKST